VAERIKMKQLLEAGVHFGHQTKRWNPKMRPYVYAARKGIYIIDLQKTSNLLDKAYDFVVDLGKQNKTLLFVCTKHQGAQTIEEESKRCGAFYISKRWIGGLLTNFSTITERIKRLHELEEMEKAGDIDKLPVKESNSTRKELERLRKYFGGIKDMKKVPDALYVVDPKREYNAVSEAHILNIPIVSIADTNCDPDDVDYIIPGNDDAIRAIKLITSKIADAYLEGKEGRSPIEEEEGSNEPSVSEVEDINESNVNDELEEEVNPDAKDEKAEEINY